MVDESELIEVETQAQRVLSTPIPERRFGAGVDVRKQQEDLLRQKAVARQNLEAAQEIRKEQAQQAAQQAEQEARIQAQREEIRRAEDRRQLIELAIRRGRVDPRDFNREDRQMISNIIASRGRTSAEFQAQQVSQQLPEGAIGSGVQGGYIFADPTARGGAREFVPVASSSTGGVIFSSVGDISPRATENISRPSSTVSLPEQPTDRLEREEERISRLRATGTPAQKFLVGAESAVVEPTRFVEQLLKDPVTRGKSLATGLKEKGKTLLFTKDAVFPEIGRTLRDEPEFAVGSVAGDIVLGKVTKVIGVQATKAGTFLSPSFREIKAGKITGIPSRELGEFDIEVIETLPTMTMRQQVELAGTKQTLVSGARDLFGVFKGEVEIRKPLSVEDKLSIKGKEALKKFDLGKLPKEGLVELDVEVKKAGAKGILERTFFADPLGRIRPSRLGLDQEDSSFLNFLSADITFKKPSSQIIVFEKQQIAQFPESIKPIAKKIRSGRELTRREYNKLLEFQTDISGDFKPVGFISGEAEVIARGTLRKKRTLGVTLIRGKRVKIIEAELSAPEINIARPNIRSRISASLDSSTGDLSSSSIEAKQYISPYGTLLRRGRAKEDITLKDTDYSAASKSSISPRSSKRIVSSFSPRSSSSRPSSSKGSLSRYSSDISPSSSLPSLSSISRPKSSSVSRFSGYSSPRLSPKQSSKSPRSLSPQSFNIPKESRRRLPNLSKISRTDIKDTGFDVLVRRRGKFIPLATDVNLSRAVQIGREKVEGSLARTFRIIPRGRAKANVELSRDTFRRPVRGGKLDLPFTFVQRSAKSLSSNLEKLEIRQSRSMKGGFDI